MSKAYQMEVAVILDAARVTLAIAVLTYASYSDYKTREVDNRVWTLFAPAGLALVLIELFFSGFADLWLYGLSFGLTSLFAVLLFYAGGFGGADAKALMCIALALPFYPQALLIPLSGEISPISQTIFPITVFSNGVLLSLLVVLWILTRNVVWHLRHKRSFFEQDQSSESLGKKALVLVTAYKMPIAKLKEKWHIYPLEDIEETPDRGYTRKLIVLPKDEGREAIVNRLETATTQGRIQDDVWASPGLPLLIPITIGLFIALFYGDLIWLFIKTILG